MWPCCYGQPSYFCYPVSEVLPKDHACRVAFPNLTSVMIPSPEQTLLHERNPPVQELEIQAAINESIQALNQEIGLLSYPDYCSNRILTLLCFYYFPTCSTSLLNGLLDPVFPCRSLCEELTAPESECSKSIDSHWGPRYKNCSATYWSGTTGGELPVYGYWNDTAKCASGTHLLKSEIASTTAAATETTTEEVTTEAPCADLGAKLPSGKCLQLQQ